MLNDAQIRKLQNKVGKKVDANIKAKEEKAKQIDLANMIEMRKNIQRLQNANSDRGACSAFWKGSFYILNPKTNKVEFSPISIKETIMFDKPEHINGKKYYFMKKEIYDLQNKALTFISEHFAEIKIASINVKNKENPLKNALMLGSVFEKFQKEFPNHSMMDFIGLYRQFEAFIIQSLNG